MMASVQNNSSEITTAATQYNRWFIAYIVSLVLVAIITLVFTLKGSQLQDAIKADAEAKIAAANAEAAKANEGVAGANLEIEKAKAEAAKANEETARLAIQLEEANAKADVERQKVAKLEIETATARRRQAEAERALLELQERLRPRTLSPAQERKLTDALIKAPRGSIEIECVRTPDNEPYTFAGELVSVLIASGWTVMGMTSREVIGSKIEGLEFRVPKNAPPHAVALNEILNSIGVATKWMPNANPASDLVLLFVGMKE